MGDMADFLTEQGETEYLMHLNGECGENGPCSYCEEEENERQAD